MNRVQFTQLLNQVHGLDVSMYDGSFLDQSIDKRKQATGCNLIEDYFDYLAQDPGEGKKFNDSLFIHFSEFFRNPLTFAVLERFTLPELINNKTTGKRKEIRIWSAGCASGQEAYSMAILLEELQAGSTEKVNYRIFATDRDETLVNEAALGRYPASGLGSVSLKRIQTWFSRQEESYIIHPALQQHVEFSVFDLLEEGRGSPPASIFGDFDLVLCCNLLLYYKPKIRNIILEKLTRSLVHGGYLVMDEAEREYLASQKGFCDVVPLPAIFQKI